MSHKNIKIFQNIHQNEGSHSKSRRNHNKKRGSIKTNIYHKSLTKVNSQAEYGLKITKNICKGISVSNLQRSRLLGKNINVKSSSNLNNINDKLMKYSGSCYKNKQK